MAARGAFSGLASRATGDVRDLNRLSCCDGGLRLCVAGPFAFAGEPVPGVRLNN